MSWPELKNLTQVKNTIEYRLLTSSKSLFRYLMNKGKSPKLGVQPKLEKDKAQNNLGKLYFLYLTL